MSTFTKTRFMDFLMKWYLTESKIFILAEKNNI